ncbi:MAG: chromosomal replication initiator protein DnaA [Gammaproteobacteria bacterium]|nr:chromosomal replication initiator protein DnaA [Gammaproteobacteria bacterium]
MVMPQIWDQCLTVLQQHLSTQQFNTWIKPLQPVPSESGLILLAPNSFVRDWINEQFHDRILSVLTSLEPSCESLDIQVGSVPENRTAPPRAAQAIAAATTRTGKRNGTIASRFIDNNGFLNPTFTFSNFITGKSNQLGQAAAIQVAENTGGIYNPLFIYGGVGLGKTHLMHACGNAITSRKGNTRAIYLHSERFVSDMVSALQRNTMEQFKGFYRSVDVLLIDDIQFLAGKERSQEEFFHVFNALVERKHQIVMTCDRYPKDITDLEDRLKSRFGWGLTVGIEPPELETRVAIVLSKAAESRIQVPNDVAFFIARHIHSNVRELEGALRRVLANAQLMGESITVDLAKEALKDVLASQRRKITIEGIQKIVVEYYKIRMVDLLGRSRKRNVTRPRQLAMALCKELTNKSLPEIGDAFGGRDHTTVMHACSKISDLRKGDRHVDTDYRLLLRTLTS